MMADQRISADEDYDWGFALHFLPGKTRAIGATNRFRLSMLGPKCSKTDPGPAQHSVWSS
jgi:hypothetical protein